MPGMRRCPQGGRSDPSIVGELRPRWPCGQIRVWVGPGQAWAHSVLHATWPPRAVGGMCPGAAEGGGGPHLVLALSPAPSPQAGKKSFPQQVSPAPPHDPGGAPEPSGNRALNGNSSCLADSECRAPGAQQPALLPCRFSVHHLPRLQLLPEDADVSVLGPCRPQLPLRGERLHLLHGTVASGLAEAGARRRGAWAVPREVMHTQEAKTETAI